ncbi:hypothetical protein OIU77_010205 [Salix suchowensis]|uniref:Secreted protein n=1 Tax=Salix suchowensis TaxID=1278906 RepID=A0ABQ9A7H9_9ROSI|nr:hypothetical protein OIU77_010205 [Salix suchowensis]
MLLYSYLNVTFSFFSFCTFFIYFPIFWFSGSVQTGKSSGLFFRQGKIIVFSRKFFLRKQTAPSLSYLLLLFFSVLSRETSKVPVLSEEAKRMCKGLRERRYSF